MNRVKRELIDRALEMRKHHLVYSEIGRLLNRSPQTVRHWCVQHLGKTGSGRALTCKSNIPVIQFLYSEMKNQGISAHRLSQTSGVSHSSILHWLSNRRSPNYLSLEAVLNTLGHTLQWTPIPKQPNPKSTQPESPSSSKLSQANGQSTTQPAN